MTNMQTVKKALRLFSGTSVDKELAHANARKWLAAQAYLGDKWILSQPVQRLTTPRSH